MTRLSGNNNVSASVGSNNLTEAEVAAAGAVWRNFSWENLLYAVGMQNTVQWIYYYHHSLSLSYGAVGLINIQCGEVFARRSGIPSPMGLSLPAYEQIPEFRDLTGALDHYHCFAGFSFKLFTRKKLCSFISVCPISLPQPCNVHNRAMKVLYCIDWEKPVARPVLRDVRSGDWGMIVVSY